MKWIIFQIQEELHKVVKVRAAESNITMRKYIMRAILEKIARDEEYEKPTFDQLGQKEDE